MSDAMKPAEHGDGRVGEDDELLEIVAACIAAARTRSDAAEAAERADALRGPLMPPPAILKTPRDAELGLTTGAGVGTPYLKTEVDGLRPLAGRRGDATRRTREIEAAWLAWGAALAGHGDDATGLALDAAADRFETLVGRLLTTPARTMDGLIAKARAFDSIFGEDDELGRHIDAEFEAFGPDASVLAFALARDVVRLARGERPPVSRRPERAMRDGGRRCGAPPDPNATRPDAFKG